MGCSHGSQRENLLIQQQEMSLQIMLCTISDINNGFFFLEKGNLISRLAIQLGFQNMQNIFTASIMKTEKITSVLSKFILPYQKDNTDQFEYQDLMIALYINSRSTTQEKALIIAEILFKNQDTLNQKEIIELFQRIFKSVMSYSFSLIDKFSQQQKEFDKPKSKEEEEKMIENQETLLLISGQNFAKTVGKSMVEADQTLTFKEFAEKCKTYIPKRFYRDLFFPTELRTSIYRDYENLDLVDRNADESKKQ